MVMREVHCGDQGGYTVVIREVHCGDQGGYTVVIREGTLW